MGGGNLGVSIITHKCALLYRSVNLHSTSLKKLGLALAYVAVCCVHRKNLNGVGIFWKNPG